MTRLIALDTSTWTASVALLVIRPDRSVEVVREETSEATGSHAAHVLALLELALAEAQWPRASMDAFVATRGPGSFTGLRVGLGTIRGLALAAERPALGVGTLDALADSLGECALPRLPLLDAGRGEVFGARFDAKSCPPVELTAPWVGPVERVVSPGSPPSSLYLRGAAEHFRRLTAAGFDGPFAVPVRSVAAAAGRIGAARLASGAADGDGLAPLYVRPADAEAPSARRPTS